MKAITNKLTTSQWVVIALSLMVYLVLALNYYDRVSHFESSHRTLAQTTTAEVANQVAFILEERQHQVKLFAEYNLPLLRALQHDPDNQATLDKMVRALRHAFPDFFAFTVTDAEGQPFIDDFEGHIGNVCIEDIQRFAKSGHYAARIHPNNFKYHYDIMTGWRGENGMNYMLMVSFEPTGLARMLNAIQPPGHELILISNTEPALIEITAKGARDKTPLSDYRLSATEYERLLARSPVPHSMWEIVDLAQPGFLDGFRKQTIFSLILFAALLTIVMGASLWFLRYEARRREAAERERQEMLSVITHEMRTPVTAISGTVTMLGQGVMGKIPDAARSSIDLLDRNAERLRRLIDDLLEIWEIELGQLSLEKQRINLNQVVKEAILSMRDYAAQLDVTVDLAEADGEIWGDADPVRVQQVVCNLVSNAAKYSPRGGVVRVGVVGLDNQTSRVFVTDAGPGIPEAFLPSIFKKFARGPAPENCSLSSTGLGLSIVKALVEAHGGEVGFETQVGKGSTFYFDLPRI